MDAAQLDLPGAHESGDGCAVGSPPGSGEVQSGRALGATPLDLPGDHESGDSRAIGGPLHGAREDRRQGEGSGRRWDGDRSALFSGRKEAGGRKRIGKEGKGREEEAGGGGRRWDGGGSGRRWDGDRDGST